MHPIPSLPVDPFGVVSREIGNKKARKNGRGRERERRKGISRLQEKDRPDFFLIFFFFFTILQG